MCGGLVTGFGNHGNGNAEQALFCLRHYLEPMQLFWFGVVADMVPDDFERASVLFSGLVNPPGHCNRAHDIDPGGRKSERQNPKDLCKEQYFEQKGSHKGQCLSERDWCP